MKADVFGKVYDPIIPGSIACDELTSNIAEPHGATRLRSIKHLTSRDRAVSDACCGLVRKITLRTLREIHRDLIPTLKKHSTLIKIFSVVATFRVFEYFLVQISRSFI